MNVANFFPDLANHAVRFALMGANGPFARSLLAQSRANRSLKPVALCDLQPDKTLELLISLGFPSDSGVICSTSEQALRATNEGKIVVVTDHALLSGLPFQILVEATGQPEISFAVAKRTLENSIHVAMVSKETDSVVGPWLNRLAVENGVVYTTLDGDQPSHAIGLVAWARTLGFEVVAAGKASEYDFIWDPDAATMTHNGVCRPQHSFRDHWHLGSSPSASIQRRSLELAEIPQSSPADYCEMTVMANSTGMQPGFIETGHPICRITELADVFVPEGDGGVLKAPGYIHAFNCLRRTDEASFAGGVFVVVRCTDQDTWRVLRAKGHVISRGLKYACLYHPFNIMGLATPLSLFDAVLNGHSSGSKTQTTQAFMAARATRDFSAGETLRMGGHHHSIEGTKAILLAKAQHGQAPYYLAANKSLRSAVSKGSWITADALNMGDSPLHAAWCEQVSLG